MAALSAGISTCKLPWPRNESFSHRPGAGIWIADVLSGQGEQLIQTETAYHC